MAKRRGRDESGKKIRKSHHNRQNTVDINLDGEIDNMQELLIEACHAFIDESVKLLKDKATSLIDTYYSSYNPITEDDLLSGDYYEDFSTIKRMKPTYSRSFQLYNALHPQKTQYKGNQRKSVGAYTLYGGLRVDSMGMNDYPNLQFKNPPTTSADDVLGQTLLNEGHNGYHGQIGSHPGKQISAWRPIRTSNFDFVKMMDDYFESEKFYNAAESKAQAVLDSL